MKAIYRSNGSSVRQQKIFALVLGSASIATVFSPLPARAFDPADLATLIATGSCTTACDLSNVTPADLGGVAIVSLEGANLDNANFSSYDLSGANLNNTSLTNTLFTLADLTGATFVNATSAGNTTFLNATLDNANFELSNLPFSEFRFSSLAGTTFDGAILTDSDFQFANLIGANLSGSILIDSNFDNIQVGNTDFSNTIVFNTSFNGSVSDILGDKCVDLNDIDSVKYSVNWADATLSNVKFDNAKWDVAIMQAITADKISAKDASFQFSNFSSRGPNRLTTLEDSEFENTALGNSCFDEVDFTDVSFNGSDLTNVVFKGAKLEGLSFKESILYSADFSDSINYDPGQISWAKDFRKIWNGAGQKVNFCDEKTMSFEGDSGIFGSPTSSFPFGHHGSECKFTIAAESDDELFLKFLLIDVDRELITVLDSEGSEWNPSPNSLTKTFTDEITIKLMFPEYSPETEGFWIEYRRSPGSINPDPVPEPRLGLAMSLPALLLLGLRRKKDK